jgi:hypothetical protein
MISYCNYPGKCVAGCHEFGHSLACATLEMPGTDSAGDSGILLLCDCAYQYFADCQSLKDFPLN